MGPSEGYFYSMIAGRISISTFAIYFFQYKKKVGRMHLAVFNIYSFFWIYCHIISNVSLL